MELASGAQGRIEACIHEPTQSQVVIKTFFNRGILEKHGVETQVLDSGIIEFI